MVFTVCGDCERELHPVLKSGGYMIPCMIPLCFSFLDDSPRRAHAHVSLRRATLFCAHRRLMLFFFIVVIRSLRLCDCAKER